MRTLYSREVENALLGLLIKKTKLIFFVSGKINVNDFFFNENQEIYNAINKIEKDQYDIDKYALVNYLEKNLKKTKEEWLEYISLLVFQSGLETNIESYIKILKQFSHLRNLELILNSSKELLYERDISFDYVVRNIEEKVFEITKEREYNEFLPITKLVDQYFEKISNFEEKKIENSEGILTNFSNLDKLLGGFKKGEFILIAARPSIGKTAFSLELLREISQKFSTCFFSIEMSKDSILRRLLSSLSFLEFHKIRDLEKLNSKEKLSLDIAKDNLKELNLFIDDSSYLTISELAWRLRKFKSINQKLDLVIIDYLQLIDWNSFNKNRYEAVSEISRSLKQLAKEINIPIIALSQLSRKIEERKNKQPLLSDLRESGALEQDADVIIFLHSSQKNESKNEFSDSDNDLKIETLEVIVAKHRNGPTGTIYLTFDKSLGKFYSKK